MSPRSETGETETCQGRATQTDGCTAAALPGS
jgi:hypothetical protein